jgi:predicted dehydrogenase
MDSLRVAFIGAGQVNFGGGEGPWDHATRLEVIAPHVPITVVGIADPFVNRAREVLQIRQNKDSKLNLWQNTQIFADYLEMLEIVKPEAVFIGTPPLFHGSTFSPRDIELQCAKRKIHMFIEKPISCAPIDEVNQVQNILTQDSNENGLVISVGYMFRYSKAIRKMKELIEVYGPPKSFNARYMCAYSNIAKTEWWDSDKCGGPIVEQGTHFCDLARYLVGEVDYESIRAIALRDTEPSGQLSRIPTTVKEDTIPPERRAPRITSAIWKFENGAVGSFMHGVVLHENKYENELEVWGDGYRLLLVDPYNDCKLIVRGPGSEKTEEFQFANDDYYLTEDLVFIQSVITKNTSSILSTYLDSYNTYKMTVCIKNKKHFAISPHFILFVLFVILQNHSFIN